MLTPEQGIDTHPTPTPANLVLPFSLTELSNIRVRPADFARMMNVSRQAVSQWVRDGKISLGADGRVDPKIAVSQLLSNCDPSKLRAKVLQPLTRDIGDQRRRIADLEKAVASLTEDRDFHAAAAQEMLEVLSEFKFQLISSWPELSLLSPSEQLDAEFERLTDLAFSEISNRKDELVGDSLDADLAAFAELAKEVSILEIESKNAVCARGPDLKGGAGGP